MHGRQVPIARRDLELDPCDLGGKALAHALEHPTHPDLVGREERHVRHVERRQIAGERKPRLVRVLMDEEPAIVQQPVTRKSTEASAAASTSPTDATVVSMPLARNSLPISIASARVVPVLLR